MLTVLLSIFIISCKNESPTEHSLQIPTINTTNINYISSASACSGGIITNEGGSPVTEKGVCWRTEFTPTIADNKTTDIAWAGNFTSYLTGLLPNTTYYVCAYATNKVGTGYGNVISFTTRIQLTPRFGGTVTDIDGNIYHTDTIGTQIWMVENLKTTRYRNGDVIPNVTDKKSWVSLRTGAYSDYNNNSENSAIYGRLYNWYTIYDTRNIAPVGWHVPTDAEWTILTNYLGGVDAAGGQLKEAGFAHWSSPNFGATNETGFTALPAGRRDYEGLFYDMGRVCNMWSSTVSAIRSMHRRLWHSYSNVGVFSEMKEEGYSIRCVKDK